MSKIDTSREDGVYGIDKGSVDTPIYQVLYRGKMFGYFNTLEGAKAHLEVLKDEQQEGHMDGSQDKVVP